MSEAPEDEGDARLRRIAALKGEFDRLRGPAREALWNLEHAHDLDLTHTSTAIEGNILTAAETATVIEQGIAVGGRPLRDHLEVVDHHDALRFVRRLARRPDPPTEREVREIHRLVLLRSAPDAAGRYADQGRAVVTDAGRQAFPPPALVPSLMAEYGDGLRWAKAGPGTAFTAHRRLVDIHPFNDGNGRTARLLMNLILLRAGFPPVAIRPIDRPAYLAGLQTAQAGGGVAAFEGLLYTRLADTLDAYVRTLRDAADAAAPLPLRPDHEGSSG